ncbi:hypothetical protein FIE12Z_5226 [Fusarium flagelliforme]|uniref:Uncharacterized protein n=1 Tax=Fusarium flagelliforme TaxID=2675880 RepID=A0A395MSR3_9HYPO|nr:hypothetical protein FIE12Z_5226 [Fusarium flagelliforme]
MPSQGHHAVDTTYVSSCKSTKETLGSATATAPATGSVGIRGMSDHGAQDDVRSVARTNATNRVVPMSNVSEPVVDRKANTRRLEKAVRDAQTRLFLADIALLEDQTKKLSDEAEQSKSSDASIDVFEKALDAFELGIDLFNVRMETWDETI